MDGYVDELGAFIEAETGGRKAVLVGTSWGAYFSLAYAMKHREAVAGLALLVPALVDGKPDEPITLVREPGVLDGEPPDVAGALRMAATVHTRAIRDVIKRDVLPARATADVAFLQRVTSARVTYHEELARFVFDKPALVVAGRQDALCGFTGAWETAARFPRATFALLDRAGHALMAEQNELLHAHLRELLARVREAAGEEYAA